MVDEAALDNQLLHEPGTLSSFIALTIGGPVRYQTGSAALPRARNPPCGIGPAMGGTKLPSSAEYLRL